MKSTNTKHDDRADSRFASSQWETVLLFNGVSHWLGASLESALWWAAVSTPNGDVILTSWWRHQMETFSALLAFCVQKSPVFSLISTRINCWVNNRETGDLRRNRTHYDITVMRFQHHDLLANRNIKKIAFICLVAIFLDISSNINGIYVFAI